MGEGDSFSPELIDGSLMLLAVRGSFIEAFASFRPRRFPDKKAR
jgi:hypothetical protein